MPELPEVETTRLGLLPQVQGKRVAEVTVREHRLRWPVPPDLTKNLFNSTIETISRRGKYLLWTCEKGRNSGFLLSHLGMSGTLRALAVSESPARHDHIDIRLDGGPLIRYTDPRRFGAMLWIAGRQPRHPLLDMLGPEPLSEQFTATHLYTMSRGRSVSIKEFVMNGRIVVGVGNIYAAESLYRAGIHPARAAGKISLARYQRLVDAIRDTLGAALRAGGSSLRDYVKTDGELGYFQVDAFVYGREGLACRVCATSVRSIVQGQRTTFFCPVCQH
jgi:formamidopyrimidine-DNA glycosylase